MKMKMKNIVLAAALSFVSISIFAQPFPAKMEGRAPGQLGGPLGGKTYIEFVRMDGDKAIVKFFVASPNCDHGVVEGIAEKKEGGWEINAPGNRCASWLIKLKPVEGKQRMEGTWQATSGNYGTVYYEWGHADAAGTHDAEAVKKLITDKTVTTQTPRGLIKTYFSPDGKVYRNTEEGTWYVKADGTHCIEGMIGGCEKVVPNGDGSYTRGGSVWKVIVDGKAL